MFRMNLVTSHDLDCFKYRLPMYVWCPKNNSPQTVVVHNLGCISNVQPQLQKCIPPDFREVQVFKYTMEKGYSENMLIRLLLLLLLLLLLQRAERNYFSGSDR